ncbi:MAG: hypothetical protein HFI90_00215 [Clostridia bacterium]|nr:hypothetical protein [Clostridia bacterium]
MKKRCICTVLFLAILLLVSLSIPAAADFDTYSTGQRLELPINYSKTLKVTILEKAAYTFSSEGNTHADIYLHRGAAQPFTNYTANRTLRLVLDAGEYYLRIKPSPVPASSELYLCSYAEPVAAEEPVTSPDKEIQPYSKTWKLDVTPDVRRIDGVSYISVQTLVDMGDYDVKLGRGMCGYYIAWHAANFDFYPESTDVLINGDWISIMHGTRVVDGIAYLPLDFVREYLDCDVSFDRRNDAVTITVLRANIPKSDSDNKPTWNRRCELDLSQCLYDFDNNQYYLSPFVLCDFGAVFSHPQVNTKLLSFYDNHRLFTLYYSGDTGSHVDGNLNYCHPQPDTVLLSLPNAYPTPIPAVIHENEPYIPLSFFTQTLGWDGHAELKLDSDIAEGTLTITRPGICAASDAVVFHDDGAALPPVNRLPVLSCTDGTQIYLLRGSHYGDDGYSLTVTTDFVTETPLLLPDLKLYSSYLTSPRAAGNRLYIHNRNIRGRLYGRPNWRVISDKISILNFGMEQWTDTTEYIPFRVLYQDGVYYGCQKPDSYYSNPPIAYYTSKDGLAWTLAGASALPTAAHEGNKAMFFDKPFAVTDPVSGLTHMKPGRWEGAYHNGWYIAQTDGDLYVSQDGETWQYLTDCTREPYIFDRIIPTDDGFFASGENVKTKETLYFFIKPRGDTWDIEILHAPKDMNPLEFDALYYVNGILYQTNVHGDIPLED